MNYGYVMARKRIEGSRINCISGYKLIPERVFQLEEDVVDGEVWDNMKTRAWVDHVDEYISFSPYRE